MSADGVIYAIRDESGFLKIGFSLNFETRLRTLQSGNAQALTLVDQISGPPKLERLLHGHFAKRRLRLEWFDDRDGGISLNFLRIANALLAEAQEASALISDREQPFEGVFALWPTLAEMGADIKREPDTIRKWRKFGRIPPDAWPALIAAAAEKGSRLSVDGLLRLNRPRKKRDPSSYRREVHPNNG